jgi:hypothetical protein
MDFEAHIAAEAAHLQRLARIPGWRNYAVDKADVYARKQPALYATLPAVVAATINEEKANELRAQG